MELAFDILASKCYLPVEVVQRIMDNGFDDAESLALIDEQALTDLAIQKPTDVSQKIKDALLTLVEDFGKISLEKTE